ncbi:MAG: ABC-type transport system involved in cytochrome c biosis, permease component [Acidimicrobiales bacterium]|nr:ABC-type transport system involved in cytochrome c biosis, permease component [Acidimicrobiales bacterium]
MTPDTSTPRQAGSPASSPSAGRWRLDPAGTASVGSRVLGLVTLVGIAAFLLVALVASPPDSGRDASINQMGEAVRIMYLHVPVAIVCFLAFFVTAASGAMYLWRKSEGWDLLAAASAEVGVVFTALTLATGSIWGRFAWGAWWVWDARLTTTALLLILFLGYLALRRAITDPVARAKRAAIAGLIGFADVPIVHYSVDWWRSLHQKATITRFNPTIDGLKLFALMFGMVVFLLVYAWLMVHRFRLQYVQARAEERGLDAAIAERRAEGSSGVASPLAGTGAAR